MFDLDAAEKVEDFELKFNGTTQTYDTILLIDTFAKEVAGKTDPKEIAAAVCKAFNQPFSTAQALQVLAAFEEHSDKFESTVKKLFGPTPSSSTTTDSGQTTSNDSTPECVTASSET